MKDLDFDELDRAVSSLMTNVPGDKPSTDADEKPEKTLTLEPSKTDDTAPAAVAASAPSAPAPAPVVPVAPASPSVPTTPSEPSDKTPMVRPAPSVPSVAARRGGRFMDVVHPSSDMKKPEQAKSPISRQGVTIAPSPSATLPAAEPSKPASAPTPTAPSTPEPAAPKSEWPDPLDVANFKDDSPAPAPLTTPFLADAKVEKRPLGGSPPPESAAPEPDKTGAGQEGLTANDANDQLPAKPGDVQTPLPEELQGDLVAIESGAAAQRVSLPDKEPETPKAPEPAPVKSPMPLPSVPEKSEPATPVEKPGTTSIPQQYREEPSTGDKASGAIYDTSDYHQPLAHPGKKKSSWLWVIWILLILLLGAGAGAALFYFKII